MSIVSLSSQLNVIVFPVNVLMKIFPHGLRAEGKGDEEEDAEGAFDQLLLDEKGQRSLLDARRSAVLRPLDTLRAAAWACPMCQERISIWNPGAEHALGKLIKDLSL